MKTIFNTYIEVESQEQADRLKQVCVDNGLPIWENNIAFKILKFDKNPIFCDNGDDFFIVDFCDFYNQDHEITQHQVTETEWMELLKKYKS